MTGPATVAPTPREHNAAGLFIGGPQLAQPWWYQVVASGSAIESSEPPTNVRSRQRHERKQRVRRLMRLQTATTGARVGRNSAKVKVEFRHTQAA